ncbi:uncharacterized [Tachysurus ichikawai]
MSSIYGSRCLRGVALSQLYSQQAATCTLVAMWRVRTQPQLLLMNLPAKKTGHSAQIGRKTFVRSRFSLEGPLYSLDMDCRSAAKHGDRSKEKIKVWEEAEEN